MVAAQSAVAGRQRRAALVAELLGMQLHRQAQALCGQEDAFGLCRREADGVAEDIHRVDQALRVLAGQPGRGVGDVVVG